MTEIVATGVTGNISAELYTEHKRYWEDTFDKEDLRIINDQLKLNVVFDGNLNFTDFFSLLARMNYNTDFEVIITKWYDLPDENNNIAKHEVYINDNGILKLRREFYREAFEDGKD